MVDPPLTLLESADLVGRYRYVELLAYRVLGERASCCSDPRILVFLESSSAAHGFRAGLFEARLPVSVGLPAAVECTHSPHPSVDRVFSLLVDNDDDGAVAAVLLGEVYPTMAAAFRRHLLAASPYSDPPIVRALDRALADLLSTCASGEQLGLSLGGFPAEHALSIRAELDRAGGPYGPLRQTDPSSGGF
jgi:hypothetical protein